MNRLNSLMYQYKFDEKLSKTHISQHAFTAGFCAARKLCAVRARIAQIEGTDAQTEVMKVGTEEAEKMTIPPELSDVIIDTLN